MMQPRNRVAVSRGDILCPVCGKASYSLGGIHPQCAMVLADEKRKKRLKAEDQAAAKRKSKRKASEKAAWNRKKCPRCGAEAHVRKRYCSCGYDFLASWRSSDGSAPVVTHPRTTGFILKVNPVASIPDKAVLQRLNQRLTRLGGAQSRVTATVRSGDVTLSGTIQYEMQRASIVKVANSIPGVRRVVDQLKLKQKERHGG